MSATPLIRTIPLFSTLKESDLRRLESRLVRRRYAGGEVLFHMGDEGGNLYIIQRGRVKVTIPSVEGEEVILAILSAGEILGEISLIDGKPRSATVQAMKDTEVLCLFREDFLEVLQERFDVVLGILEILADRLRHTDVLLAESRFMDITARLAKKLLDLTRAFGIQEENGVRIGVRVTQKDLASMVGATRESVNKQLRVLRESGLLSMTEGHIRVLDPEGLARRIRSVDAQAV
ncbi:MAG: Crp/Fnr family transcriptional regulator [Deltaproteobacteria bacterium]|nr:Crp/Fnr family transcriptional regulator [Deltaproteobacteria bacterium]